MLTELEGAILAEIHHRGNQTAFKVRRAFEKSPSIEWSGSAGAVYPAIRRLVSSGLIRSETTAEKRGTRLLSLTARGRAQLGRWTTCVDRAVTVGVDPFRLRVSLWAVMPRSEWRALRPRLEAGLLETNRALEAWVETVSPGERPGVEMAIALNDLRLRWLKDL